MHMSHTMTDVIVPANILQGIAKSQHTSLCQQALHQLSANGKPAPVHCRVIQTCGSLIVQWGAVERQPGAYDWSGYQELFSMVKSIGLRIQAVMSFHACGGNVGDYAQVPLPEWVLKVGLRPRVILQVVHCLLFCCVRRLKLHEEQSCMLRCKQHFKQLAHRAPCK